jgi:hypothetical protein
MEAETQARRYHVFQVKYPSLLADLNQTYIVSTARVKFAKSDVSGHCHQRKPRYRRKVTLFSK